MSVTVYDIAREANVSIGAVSKALNDKKGVSEELRSRIKGIASRLQYQPYLRSSDGTTKGTNQRHIVCVFGRTGWHLAGDIHAGIDAALMETEFLDTRYIVDVEDMLQEHSKKIIFDRILNDDLVAGVLFAFVPLTDSDIARFRRAGIPVVNSIAVDDFGAAYDATSKFIEFGHREIGCILPNEFAHQVWRDRLGGYKKALGDHGIPYDSGWVGLESTFVPREAGLVTHELLVNNPKMTAILYGSDFQAMGGLKMLKEMHLNVPGDVAVMGFDNMTACDLMDPPLSSVRLPMFDLGKIGTEILLRCIQAGDVKAEPRLLKAELVLRRSADESVPKVPWL